MNEEKEKKSHEIAAKLSDEIAANCEPDEAGLVISLVMKNIHTKFRLDITNSEQALEMHNSNYTAFLKNIDFPQINDKKEASAE